MFWGLEMPGDILRAHSGWRNRATRRKLFYGLVGAIVLVLLFKAYANSGQSPLRFGTDESTIPPSVWRHRAERVRDAAQHAYRGYDQHARPKDELRPLLEAGVNEYNGWGVTAFDSLDTLSLLGLTEEYNRALEVVRNANFTSATGYKGLVPYFETVIRYLGGLLSAYAMTKDEMLLRRAEELADILDPIFSTPSGLPTFAVHPTTKEIAKPFSGAPWCLAEIASWQLEYTYLAKVSGKKKYMDRVQHLNEILYNSNLHSTNGMLPTDWDVVTGAPDPKRVQLSLGSRSDSGHEYLLKQYLLTAKTDKRNLELYLHATAEILTNLLRLSPDRELLYVTDILGGDGAVPAPSHKLEHLACFLPGLLALGAHTLPLNQLYDLGIDMNTLGADMRFGNASSAHTMLKQYDLKKLHLAAAEGLAQTCWLTYADQPTGLAPEEIQMRPLATGSYEWSEKQQEWVKVEHQLDKSYIWFDRVEDWRKAGSKGHLPGTAPRAPIKTTGKDSGRDYYIRSASFSLRPETVESFYILWRVTGDTQWRTRGWAVFEAIEQVAKRDLGYVEIKDIGLTPPVPGKTMPSYFLAETLKYLYLLFIEDDPIPLDKWVFNTEAHPFPIFEWTEDEIQQFGIRT